jgi:hypothetical protein
MLIYDCEIVRAIPPREGEERIPSIEYCAGWQDFANMGISVIGAFDYTDWLYRVFCRDNWEQFQELVNERDVLVGFNNISFDNHLLRANDFYIPEKKCIDLLQIIWAAAGLEPPYNYKTHSGYGLNAICKANFQEEKTGRGDLAPVQWQRGEIGAVIDYCLHDIRLTKKLYDHINLSKWLKNPKTGENMYIENRKLHVAGE